jgi:adenosylcobinamide-phosphate synthase
MNACAPPLAASPAMLAVALGWDVLLGDPPNAVHPVAWIGRFARVFIDRAPREGPARQLLVGALIALAVPATCVGLVWAAARATQMQPVLAFWVGAALLKSTFAVRGLGAAGRVVRDALREGRLADARRALSSLCSRDATTLDESQLAGAAIESLAENLSDSFVGPLLGYLLFGLPGAFAYRAINTLDSMIGYRGPYEFLGKAAARLDDLVNLVPARVTALLLVAAGFSTGADAPGGLRVLRRDRRATASPNAGWPMATMAGLLGVVLEKDGDYRLGDGLRPAAGADIARAWRIVAVAAALAAVLGLAALVGGRACG